MPEEEGTRQPAQAPQEAGRLGSMNVLQSPLSVIRMDVSELRNFTNRLNEFMASPSAAAIKICECCINVD